MAVIPIFLAERLIAAKNPKMAAVCRVNRSLGASAHNPSNERSRRPRNSLFRAAVAAALRPRGRVPSRLVQRRGEIALGVLGEIEQVAAVQFHPRLGEGERATF
jgi:hypothetical protein